MKNQPDTMKNQPGTMKNHPRTMKNHENQPGTMKNHETPPGTMKNHDNPPGTMSDHFLLHTYKQTLHHNTYIIIIKSCHGRRFGCFGMRSKEEVDKSKRSKGLVDKSRGILDLTSVSLTSDPPFQDTP